MRNCAQSQSYILSLCRLGRVDVITLCPSTSMRNQGGSSDPGSGSAAVDTLRGNIKAFLAGPRGCRGQAHVALWRHWQRVKRRSLHARRGIRPCDHETETITDVEQPARSAEYHSIITHRVDSLVSMFKIPVLQLLDMDQACSDLVLGRLALAFRPWNGNDLRLHLLVVL